VAATSDGQARGKVGAEASEAESASGGLTWERGPVPDKLLHLVIERLVRAGRITAEAEVLRLPEHKVSLASDQSALREKVLAAYVAGGETPPNTKDVLENLKVSPKEAAGVYRLLVEQGELVKVKEEMYFHAPAFAGIQNKVTAFITGKGEMSAPDFKELTGLSRKYAIPILEHLDKEKVTVRVGDVRKLRKIG
jgi:selenocysteine-specific elongation factor